MPEGDDHPRIMAEPIEVEGLYSFGTNFNPVPFEGRPRKFKVLYAIR